MYRYVSLDGTDVISAEGMEKITAAASEHGWVITRHSRNGMITVKWSDSSETTYVPEEM